MRIIKCIWQAIEDTSNHDGVEHAGYLAYLTLLALCPFLVLLTSIAGVIGNMQIGQGFIEILLKNLPAEVTRALAPRINELSAGPPEGLLPIALIAALWTSSSAVEGLRTTLNRAYRVTTPPSYFFRRLLSIAQFLLFMALLICGMLALVFAPIVIDYLQNKLGINLHLSSSFGLYSILVITVVLFGAISLLYYLLPNIKQKWLEVTPGAILVAVLWVISGFAFSAYLANFNQVNLVYGSLEGIIVTLIFFYIMNLIFIFGAELNYHLHNR